MKPRREIHFRVSAAPRVALALGARSVGHYACPPDYVEHRAPRDFVQVFWGVAGAAQFFDGRRRHVLMPGHVFVYPPGRSHRIHAGSAGVEYRWWTMDGPLAASIVAAFGLTPPRSLPAGPAPVDLFERLTALVMDVSPAAEPEAGAVAYALLTAAVNPTMPRTESAAPTRAERCARLLRERFSDSRTGVEQIALELGVDRSVLSRQFRAAHGLPPAGYLRAIRVQQALAMLKEGGLAVAEVLHNASPARLYEEALRHDGALLAANGALVVRSGVKTGRSPRDKRVVDEPAVRPDVWWGDVNIRLSERTFLTNRQRAVDFLNTRPRLYVVDGFAGWDPRYRLKVRVICARPYHALFMQIMLIRPSDEERRDFGTPELTIYNAEDLTLVRETRRLTFKQGANPLQFSWQASVPP